MTSPDADAVRSADRNRFRKPQRIELINISLQRRVVNFIDGQNDRLAAAPQHPRDELVVAGYAIAAVDDKQNDVGFLDRNFDLGFNFFLKRLVFQLNSASVNDAEILSQPRSFSVNPVPGHARGILDDGNPFAQDPIKNR